MTEFKFDRMPKYRAWDRERKIMIEVHGLTFPAQPDFLGAVFDGDNDLPWKGRFDVLQYTGRQDTEGREACEADIVGVEVVGAEPLIGVVVFRRGRIIVDHPGLKFSWQGAGNDDRYHTSLGFFPFKILGTTYQNPELIARAEAYGVGI